VFLAGVLFILTTLLRLRQWSTPFPQLSVTATPSASDYSRPASFRPGHLTSLSVLLSVFGFLLITVLTIRRFPAAILTGVLVTAVLSFVTRVAPAPTGWVSRPPSLQPVFFQLDLHSLFTWDFSLSC
jgi:AGZA family xanthine/uracil permease-like MFS transporter